MNRKIYYIITDREYTKWFTNDAHKPFLDAFEKRTGCAPFIPIDGAHSYYVHTELFPSLDTPNNTLNKEEHPTYFLVTYPTGSILDEERRDVKEKIRDALSRGQEIEVDNKSVLISVPWKPFHKSAQDTTYCVYSHWSGRMVKEWCRQFFEELEQDIKAKTTYSGHWHICLLPIGDKIDPNSYGSIS